MATILVPVVKDYILVVDDEKPVTELIKKTLIKEGEVHVAYDGEEGIEYVMKQDYDLIITDMNMPQKDGISFYTEVTKKKPHLKGRFLFMAGYFSDELLAYFQKHGIEHLIKPASIKDIRIAAKKVLLLTKKSNNQN